MTQTLDFLAPLNDLAVLRIDGEDAARFLHAQLSNDIEGLGPNDARLAAYCNPKGRMLGSLVIWRETGEPGSPLLALAKADLVEPLLKRLRMFVLRAKVRFEATELRAHGASFSPREAAAAAAPVAVQAGSGMPLAAEGGMTAEAAPPGAGTPWSLRRAGPLTCITAPVAAEGHLREWWVAPADADPAALAGVSGLATRGADAWQVQDIAAGLGWVEQANVELFIPQSLNYDLSGGVSFTKGCYPGQEIVARAHFRGTVKRRAVPGHCLAPADAGLHAGTDIFDARRPGAPAGRVINAAARIDDEGRHDGWLLFMEVSLADLGEADFRALSAEGPAIRLLALPYPLEARN